MLILLISSDRTSCDFNFLFCNVIYSSNSSKVSTCIIGISRDIESMWMISPIVEKQRAQSWGQCPVLNNGHGVAGQGYLSLRHFWPLPASLAQWSANK